MSISSIYVNMIVEFFLNIRQYLALFRAERTAEFYFVLIVNLGIFLYTMVMIPIRFRKYPLLCIGKWIHAIIFCAIGFLFGFSVFAADAIALPREVMTTNRFFIETVIVTILSVIVGVFCLLLQDKDYDGEPIEREEAEGFFNNIIVKPLFLIVLSLVFYFTNLENTLPNWGFQFLGRTLGQWISNLYFATAITVAVGMVAQIIEALLSSIQTKTMV